MGDSSDSEGNWSPRTDSDWSNDYSDDDLDTSSLEITTDIFDTSVHTNVDDICVVCQLDFENGEEISFLVNCTHFFHHDCIMGWVSRKRDCPTCRTSIKSSSYNVPESQPVLQPRPLLASPLPRVPNAADWRVANWAAAEARIASVRLQRIQEERQSWLWSSPGENEDNEEATREAADDALVQDVRRVYNSTTFTTTDRERMAQLRAESEAGRQGRTEFERMLGI